MNPDIGSQHDGDSDSSAVVATVDTAAAGDEFIIADISQDRSWISVPESTAVDLNDSR